MVSATTYSHTHTHTYIYIYSRIYISLASVVASKITGISTVCSALCLGWYQRLLQSPDFWPFLRGIRQMTGESWGQSTVDQLIHLKVSQKAFPCHDIIMYHDARLALFLLSYIRMQFYCKTQKLYVSVYKAPVCCRSITSSYNYSDLTWALCRSKLPVMRLFVQQLAQAKTRGKTKVTHCLHFVSGIHLSLVVPLTKGVCTSLCVFLWFVSRYSSELLH